MDGDYEVVYSEGEFRVQRPEDAKLQVQPGMLGFMLSNPTADAQYLQFPLFVGKK